MGYDKRNYLKGKSIVNTSQQYEMSIYLKSSVYVLIQKLLHLLELNYHFIHVQEKVVPYDIDIFLLSTGETYEFTQCLLFVFPIHVFLFLANNMISVILQVLEHIVKVVIVV